MIYSLLSSCYDEINKEIDYAAWACFIDRLAVKFYGKRPELALDLGCGTGSMTLELSRLGYDMTGVDISPEMLDVARGRAEAEGLDGKILWLMQDMTAFELYGTVDLAVSCLDCINHLTKREELMKCLLLVHNYLSPNGIFIFDINGRAKFEKVYADNSFVYETDEGVVVWQNSYNERSRLCDFYITAFSEDADGRYSRSDAVERERMYTLGSIKRALSEAGFEFLGAYSDFELSAGDDTSERIYVAARCIKENK